MGLCSRAPAQGRAQEGGAVGGSPRAWPSGPQRRGSVNGETWARPPCRVPLTHRHNSSQKSQRSVVNVVVLGGPHLLPPQRTTPRPQGGSSGTGPDREDGHGLSDEKPTSPATQPRPWTHAFLTAAHPTSSSFPRNDPPLCVTGLPVLAPAVTHTAQTAVL